MLTVVQVVSFVDGAATYRFSDGSTGVHQNIYRDGRFLRVGPLDTLNAAQLQAVSNFNAQANKPDGGWL
jgi:hypothetical protein